MQSVQIFFTIAIDSTVEHYILAAFKFGDFGV